MNGDATRFWEEHYGARTQVWSGRANAALVDVAGSLPPGRALDLGCGEGGDAVWLAARGWQVTAVDVSATALARVGAAAAAAGVEDRVRVERHDLDRTFPPGEFDLVSAQFLQSPIEFGREDVLRRAAAAVAPGGLLLVVAHAQLPPWAPPHDPPPRLPTPAQDLAALGLPPGWTVERAGTATREATGPDGTRGTLVDSVVAVRRNAE